jgi:hypothetical protein
MLAEIEKMRADGPSQQRPSTNRLISIKDEHARLIEDKAKAEKEVKTLQVSHLTTTRQLLHRNRPAAQLAKGVRRLHKPQTLTVHAVRCPTRCCTPTGAVLSASDRGFVSTKREV